jgi:hypothetical protein
MNYSLSSIIIHQWIFRQEEMFTLQYIRKASFTKWSRSSWFWKVSSGFLVNIVETIHNNWKESNNSNLCILSWLNNYHDKQTNKQTNKQANDLHGAESFLRAIVTQERNVPPFTKPKDSLSYSQEIATGPYHKPNGSSTQPNLYLLCYPFIQWEDNILKIPEKTATCWAPVFNTLVCHLCKFINGVLTAY